MYQYFSSIKQNTDVLQAIASVSGRKTRLSVSHEGEDRTLLYRLSVKEFPWSEEEI